MSCDRFVLLFFFFRCFAASIAENNDGIEGVWIESKKNESMKKCY